VSDDATFGRGSRSTIPTVAILSMHTVSTRSLGERPDIPTFRRLTRSLAVLDAILVAGLGGSVLLFNAHWGPGELMASMRNGQGDQWFALINASGIIAVPLDAVAAIYRHEPLTDALVARLNPALDVHDLASDLAEIGFPESR